MRTTSLLKNIMFNGILAAVTLSIAFAIHENTVCNAALPVAETREECLKKAVNVKDSAIIAAKNAKDAADINCKTIFDNDSKACATDSDTRIFNCDTIALTAAAAIAINYAYQSSLCAAASVIPPAGAACQAAASAAAAGLTIFTAGALAACLLDSRNERLNCEKKHEISWKAPKPLRLRTTQLPSKRPKTNTILQ